METAVLNILTNQLTHVLKDSLPKISTTWWKSLVIEKLTFQQRLYRQYNPDSLEQLDLAALLRVVDQNWYELTQKLNLNKEARNWLKEAQTNIRNRWAHAPADGLPDEVYYRDLDTIERLLQTFDANAETLDKISAEKQNLLLKIATTKAPVSTPITENAPTGLFKPGDMELVGVLIEQYEDAHVPEITKI